MKVKAYTLTHDGVDLVLCCSKSHNDGEYSFKLTVDTGYDMDFAGSGSRDPRQPLAIIGDDCGLIDGNSVYLSVGACIDFWHESDMYRISARRKGLHLRNLHAGRLYELENQSYGGFQMRLVGSGSLAQGSCGLIQAGSRDCGDADFDIDSSMLEFFRRNGRTYQVIRRGEGLCLEKATSFGRL